MTGAHPRHVLADVDATVDGIPSVRRGLDPRVVRQILTAAAQEIGQAWRERDLAVAENERVKAGLRKWQTDQYEGTHGQVPLPRPLRDNEVPW